jgi:two-component system KDP operon response regulator KdpE
MSPTVNIESGDGTIQPAGRLLIVDDDYAVRRTLHLTLYGQGFDVSEASSADEALALARAVRFDAALLDVNMPGKNGIELCREMRTLFPRMAILMLTVRSDQDDRVEALDSGADDYVVKPFHVRELTARIRAAMRRMDAAGREHDTAIQIGAIRMDMARRIVEKDGQPIHLTPKEFDLLHHLIRQSGLPVAHSKLLSSVWGSEYANQVEYLRTFVRQLRKKLEDDPTAPRYLLTESHVGYRFADARTLATQTAGKADE